jgi:hypothetical protein
MDCEQVGHQSALNTTVVAIGFFRFPAELLVIHITVLTIQNLPGRPTMMHKRCYAFSSLHNFLEWVLQDFFQRWLPCIFFWHFAESG